MPHGGRRPGAGIPRGTICRKTRERAELLSLWREAVARRFDEVIDAQLNAAMCVRVLLAQDEDGHWRRVTDPDAMVASLNAGGCEISDEEPDARMLKDILDRLFGRPAQAVNVAVQPASVLSDEQLRDRLQTLPASLDGEKGGPPPASIGARQQARRRLRSAEGG